MHSADSLVQGPCEAGGMAQTVCVTRHAHAEFICFLNAVEHEIPLGKLVHAVVDNYATHKRPKVKAWLERHPRWTFHFIPTSGSWLNSAFGAAAPTRWSPCKPPSSATSPSTTPIRSLSSAPPPPPSRMHAPCESLH